MIQWIKELFGKKEKFVSKLSPEQNRYIDARLYYQSIELQEFEDRGWDVKIQSEAKRMYEEWREAGIIIKDKRYQTYIPLVNLPPVYLVYNNETARYGGDKAHKKVMELYNEMIANYEKEK